MNLGMTKQVKKIYKSVVIVVPIYKALDYFEQISIKQLFLILGNYDICFVVPNSLQIEKVGIPIGKSGWRIERFEDKCFSNRSEYSRLCLDKRFYQRFQEYEYMLIYQTDAFVFSDRLMEYIKLDYDYIGAPIDSFPYWEKYHVGNGGLSLRRIAKCLRMLEIFWDDLWHSDDFSEMLWAEDLFWGYCGYSREVDFNVPSVEIAGTFALENDSCNLYKNIKQNGLPFGVHMWWKIDYPFWKPFIERNGYLLLDSESVNHYSSFERYYIERVESYTNGWIEGRYNLSDNSVETIKKRILFRDRYSIWGMGRYGTLIAKILIKLGIRIDVVFDNAACEDANCDNDCCGISVVMPSKEGILVSGMIIISVMGKEKDIERQIEKLCGERYSEVETVSYAKVLEAFGDSFEKAGYDVGKPF